MSTPAEFSRCLLNPERDAPEGLTTWNGSDPAQRFAVYRNNVTVSLVDALADTFPVTQALVGTEFFRAMALIYARQHPPRSRQMMRYGATLPDFIARFEPAASLPYLPDVARFERSRVDAYHADDAPPVPIEELAQALANGDALDQLRLTLHPSVSVSRSAYAIFSLWSAHQQTAQPERLQPWPAESVVTWRRDDTVWSQPVPDADATCLAALFDGQTLGDATAIASNLTPDFDLTPLLTLLVRENLITSLNGKS